MTTEEKAKAYDDALKVIKECNPDENGFITIYPQEIFSELKESEDERIRKEIFHFILENTLSTDMRQHRWLAWLEKQGKQKSIDDLTQQEAMDIAVAKCFEQGEQKSDNKIEPKFHEGDWVVWDNKISCHIDNICQGKEFLMYTITDIHNMTRSYSVKGFDNNAHLWSIKDAKDGDVLAYVTDEEDLWIMIYWSLYEPYEGHVHYHALLVNDNFSDKGTCCICIDDLKPATKEQSERLFQRMKEAGYEFDFKKKELRKIENSPILSNSSNIGKNEQKYVNKVKSKFHEGDWCIDNEDDTIFQIVKVLSNTYTYRTIEGKYYSCTHYSLENDARLWTIQDARAGDVLTSAGCIFIFKKINDGWIYCYCLYHPDGSFIPETYNLMTIKYSNEVYPATLEECEKLERATKEAGYEWDAEKKELRKIENFPILSNSSNIGKDLQVDGFDAELNTLLKKYEHLSKKELQETLEFYLGVIRDDLDIVREEKPKWNEEMKFRKFDIITNGEIEYEIRDIQKNQLGDWVYILYNANIARLSSPGAHLPDGSIRWVCEQVDKQFELKQRMEEQQ